jgi:hypothetical protein
MGNETEGKLVQSNPFGGGQAVGGMVSIEQQRAIAEVQAAILVARSMPRNRMAALDNILRDCTDPDLAEEAEYEYSRGGTKVTGPSIRLMETIVRRWGNFESGVREIARREGYSELETYAWDMETNTRDRKVFQIRHWRDTKAGGYAVEGERDVYEITANMAARRKRACMQAVIPAEVVNAAVEQCRKTLGTKVQVTAETVQSMLAKFAEYGVTREMIEVRIQRHIDAVTPALMVQLGRIYNSIKDGMSSAGDWFEGLTPVAVAEQPKTGTAKLAEGVKAKAKREAPTTQDVLTDIKTCCAKANEAKDVELGHLALDDAADLARALGGQERLEANAAIDAAMKALAERFKKP